MKLEHLPAARRAQVELRKQLVGGVRYRFPRLVIGDLSASVVTNKDRMLHVGLLAHGPPLLPPHPSEDTPCRRPPLRRFEHNRQTWGRNRSVPNHPSSVAGLLPLAAWHPSPLPLSLPVPGPSRSRDAHGNVSTRMHHTTPTFCKELAHEHA